MSVSVLFTLKMISNDIVSNKNMINVTIVILKLSISYV